VQFEFGQPRDPKSTSVVKYFFNRKSETSTFYTILDYKTEADLHIKTNKDFPKLFDVPKYCSPS
jgi:hypothetical protein